MDVGSGKSVFEGKDQWSKGWLIEPVQPAQRYGGDAGRSVPLAGTSTSGASGAEDDSTWYMCLKMEG